MKKSKITRSEANAVEKIKKGLSLGLFLDFLEEGHLIKVDPVFSHKYSFDDSNLTSAVKLLSKALPHLKEELLNVVTQGYQVIAPFEKGDLITRKDGEEFSNGKKVVEVASADEHREYVKYHSSRFTMSTVPFSAIRLASSLEQEDEWRRQWWSSKDRDVWGLRPNDILLHREVRTPLIVKDFKAPDAKGYGFIQFSNEKKVHYFKQALDLENIYTVAVFCDKRLDQPDKDC